MKIWAKRSVFGAYLKIIYVEKKAQWLGMAQGSISEVSYSVSDLKDTYFQPFSDSCGIYIYLRKN